MWLPNFIAWFFIAIEIPTQQNRGTKQKDGKTKKKDETTTNKENNTKN